MTSAALGGKKTIANKLTHMLAALSELEDATVQYKHEVRLEDDGSMVRELTAGQPLGWGPDRHYCPALFAYPTCCLTCLTWLPAPLCPQELTVSWLLSSGAKSDVIASLAPAVPAAPVLASMLELLVDNLAAVKATALTAMQHMREFEKQVGGRVGEQCVGGCGCTLYFTLMVKNSVLLPPLLGSQCGSSVPPRPPTHAVLQACRRRQPGAEPSQHSPRACLQASRSQELVDKYVNTKAAQDKETNAKVAALLNSKKKKLREMQASPVLLAAAVVCAVGGRRARWQWVCGVWILGRGRVVGVCALRCGWYQRVWVAGNGGR